jgi:hypothetical protein
MHWLDAGDLPAASARIGRAGSSVPGLSAQTMPSRPRTKNESPRKNFPKFFSAVSVGRPKLYWKKRLFNRRVAAMDRVMTGRATQA